MQRAFIIELGPEERISLCTCNKSQKMPLCDGNHRNGTSRPISVSTGSDGKTKITGFVCTDEEQNYTTSKEGCCKGDGNKGCCRNKATD
jgi:hypothetical protein